MRSIATLSSPAITTSRLESAPEELVKLERTLETLASAPYRVAYVRRRCPLDAKRDSSQEVGINSFMNDHSARSKLMAAGISANELVQQCDVLP